MQYIAGIFVAIGSAMWWLVQNFLPFFIKKYGRGAVRFAIQKSVSSLVILVTLAFYASVIVFISESYTMFREISQFLQDPTLLPSKVGVSGGQDLWSCFIYLFDCSGMRAGFNSGINFGITVFIFFFLRGLYSITQKTVSQLSAEIKRMMKSVY